MKQKLERLHLENVRIIYKNFQGEKTKFNDAGKRVFSVVIDDLNQAEQLIDLGWALRPLVNEEGEIDAYHLPVKINYASHIPPRIYKVFATRAGSMLLDENTISMLDYLPIEYADVILNPYNWEVKGETGVKAYCHTMYVVVEENLLDLKWANRTFDEPSLDSEE
jgi:hypothetical protein